jgi:hypothetical protein
VKAKSCSANPLKQISFKDQISSKSNFWNFQYFFGDTFIPSRLQIVRKKGVSVKIFLPRILELRSESTNRVLSNLRGLEPSKNYSKPLIGGLLALPPPLLPSAFMPKAEILLTQAG